ncbi:MAG: rRNA maturation RNase YbeY [Rickettsiales bacterium]|jgi:probable rRNA maturation factor|nr:rRNA maturation RNase YbeY [Rickettsiales bacterium]
MIKIDVIKKCNFNVTKKFCKEIFELVLEYFILEKRGNKRKNLSFPNIEFSITFDKDIRQLNRQYRNVDKNTNVLTFSLYKNKQQLMDGFEKMPCIILGDIFFSYDKIKEEMREQNKTFHNHFTHLLIHSYLHLLTLDHMKKQEQKKMEMIEINVLKKLGIDNPYV